MRSSYNGAIKQSSVLQFQMLIYLPNKRYDTLTIYIKKLKLLYNLNCSFSPIHQWKEGESIVHSQQLPIVKTSCQELFDCSSFVY